MDLNTRKLFGAMMPYVLLSFARFSIHGNRKKQKIEVI
jgi:hypothetical protein